MEPEGMRSSGFPAIARSDARVLILGSLPGLVSLAQGEYYAQPRNAFWRIMEALFAIPVSAPYAQRTQQLVQNRIALWDVCAAASRVGSSLDAKINLASVVPNDFVAFFAAHPSIRLICFNGATAEKLYLRLVQPGLSSTTRGIPYRRLPSTSPAHAITPEMKLQTWRTALHEAGGL
jgi:double-stranded uracil-DNA glycosylase